MPKPNGPFAFCPKHNVFFKTCGCPWEKKQKKEDKLMHVTEEHPEGIEV